MARKPRNLNEAIHALKNIFSETKHFQKTQDEHLGLIIQLKEKYGLTLKEWRYFTGYSDCLYDQICQKETMRFRHWKDKVYESKWETLPEDYKEFCRNAQTREIDSTIVIHWKNADGTPGKVWA